MDFKVQQRYVLTVIAFIGMTIAFAERTVLSMALTRMVEIPNQNDSTPSKTEPICEAPDWASNKTIGTVVIDQAQYGVKYNWTQKQQGIILSSFYAGYIITHVPGGLLAQNFGGKYVLGLSITISALCSMAIPLAVRYVPSLLLYGLAIGTVSQQYIAMSNVSSTIQSLHAMIVFVLESGDFYAIITMRVLMGAFQGPIIPALIQLLANWVPATERAFLTSLVYSGTGVGIVFASYFAGIIMHYYSWESVFYLFGMLAVVWFLIYCFICYDSPARHPFISIEEQNYLSKELGQLQRDKNQSPTPWMEMFSSKPVWALIIAKFCSDWVYNFASTTLPKYMNDVLHLSIRDIGTYNSLPWILKTITSFAFAFIIDRSIASGKIGITNARKLAVFLASTLPAIFIMLATYAECGHVMVIVSFIIAVGMHGFATPGLNPNAMDLCPNYSGILMGVVNGAAAITGILVPYISGLMTPNAYLSEWRLVFWAIFAIYLVKTIVFTIWGSGEIQPFNPSKSTLLITEQSALVKAKVNKQVLVEDK